MKKKQFWVPVFDIFFRVVPSPELIVGGGPGGGG